MTKKITFIVLLVLAVALAVGIFAPAPTQAAKNVANGHLLWDNVDKVFICTGSAVDCSFAPNN